MDVTCEETTRVHSTHMYLVHMSHLSTYVTSLHIMSHLSTYVYRIDVTCRRTRDRIGIVAKMYSLSCVSFVTPSDSSRTQHLKLNLVVIWSITRFKTTGNSSLVIHYRAPVRCICGSPLARSVPGPRECFVSVPIYLRLLYCT